MKPRKIPTTRHWWLSAPTYIYLAGVAFILGAGIVWLAPGWAIGWPL